MASSVPIHVFPSTKETTNYSRLCRLLVDVGSQVLRQKFDSICPPATLDTILTSPTVHATLTKLKARRVLNPSQWDKLYPSIRTVSVSSKDFDITLLMVLLRNICALTPPITGWDNLPLVTDVTPEADIARIKWYRNTLYGHASQASVDDATFASCWMDIKATLVRLGGASYGPAIDLLKNECMDPGMEEHYKKLLKQWKVDEDVKDKFSEVAEKLDELKTLVTKPERSLEPVEKEPFDLEGCKAQLCTHYNSTMSQVRITPWDRDNTVDIDEMYTTLSWMRDVKTPSGTDKRELDDYTEIFKGHGRIKNPKRILVYGRPGIGKSTFSQKLAVDWANGRKENLKVFDLFLLIKLRDVDGTQDLAAILNASKLLAADGLTSTDSLYDYVLHNQEKVLLVLDGFDEFSGGKKSTIHEIWEGGQLRDCHVIMTTRQMEGEELMKFSHLQFEIRGFLSEEQVNFFASKFITDQKDIKEFENYLNKMKLREVAEIPLLLLMLCLIWRDRDRKELPTSKLGLHERFVETMLYHLDVNDPDNIPEEKAREEEKENEKESESVLDKYKVELAVIGRLALEGLLQRTLYLRAVNVQSGSLTDKMVRSGLFQFSKLAVADPNKTVFFLHKSIQEYLAAWYIMNEAGLEKNKCAGIDSFSKVWQLFYILKFMCEWSEKGAKAVFSLLRFIGGKDDLTQCRLSNTPSIHDLSLPQRRFRDLSLECLFNCSTSFRQDLYPSFLSFTSGVAVVGEVNRRKIDTEHLPSSNSFPGYFFFHGRNLPVGVLAELNASIVTPYGGRLDASEFIQKHIYSSLEPESFSVIKEGDSFYLYFTEVSFKGSRSQLVMLRELVNRLRVPAAQSPSQKQRVCKLSSDHGQSVDDTENQSFSTRHCLSLVRTVFFLVLEKEELVVLSDLLPFVSFPRKVLIGTEKRVFDAELVNKVISRINITDNLCSLSLINLNVTADVKTSIQRATPSTCKVEFEWNS